MKHVTNTGQIVREAAPQPQQAAPVAVPDGPQTEFVLNELRSALNAMITFFGMDEDESNKEVFDKARQAYDYANIVMRPLEPWERQSLADLRACLRRWHDMAVAKGYDGVGPMCETALPYGTRDLRLVPLAASPQAALAPPQGAPAPQQALTQAQRIRLLNNSPEYHGDVVGRDAFERLVKLVESVHRIGEPAPQRKALTDEQIRREKPVCADFVSFRAGVRCAERICGVSK